MQRESSSSVRISWLNRADVLRRLREAVGTNARCHPEVERVILFGSLARGDAVPGSDADLLVVLANTDLPFLDRSVRYQPDGVGIGVDVFAYTEDELEKMIGEGNYFIRQARSEGIVLFERGSDLP